MGRFSLRSVLASFASSALALAACGEEHRHVESDARLAITVNPVTYEAVTSAS